MVDSKHSRSIRNGRSAWGGHSEVLALDEHWRPPMIWRIITFATSGIIAAVMGHWAFDREPPTRIIRTEVLSHVVQPGGELRIKYSVDRVRSCRMHLDRFIYNNYRRKVVVQRIAEVRRDCFISRFTFRSVTRDC